MSKLRLIVVGGFLGSGKTTLIMNLGRKIALEMNRRVAVITNDQGETLVDTKMMETLGFTYAEVVNGCFCCRFPEFITKIREILSRINPDIILAEPVGSCTDLLATVYAPLNQYYGETINLSPYLVLIDSSTILNYNQSFRLTSPREPLGFLISWQIKEAEVLGLNKVDLVSSKQIERIEEIVKEINGEAEIIQISARTGYNIDKLTEILLTRNHRSKPSTEVNYDVYSKAEKELGWFNASCKVVFKQRIDLESYARNLMNEVAKQINTRGGLITHEKMLFLTKNSLIKASFIVSNGLIDFVGKFPKELSEVNIIINIRAKLEPEDITESVEEAFNNINPRFNGERKDWLFKSFKPPYPKPYYRLPHT